MSYRVAESVIYGMVRSVRSRTWLLERFGETKRGKLEILGPSSVGLVFDSYPIPSIRSWGMLGSGAGYCTAIDCYLSWVYDQ
jgi:hypothetical protein